MIISGLNLNPYKFYLRCVALALFVAGSVSAPAQTTTAPTTINVSDTPKLKDAKRLGLVLGNQDFYDSGQFMRNIAFRNPGFEGEIWQSILHCEFVTANSCTDDDLYTYWPANFFANAQAEFIVGAAAGAKATVKSSTAATIGTTGVTISFASLPVAPAAGDYVVVRMSVPGNAQAGWWTQGTGGTTFSTEFNDLSPNTPGKQALRITQGPSDQASLTSYMDSVPGRSFLQLHGSYTLTFRAKGTGGNNKVNIGLGRAVDAPPGVSYFNQTITLTDSWQDYSFTFQANDTGRVGTLALKFFLGGSSMLIDDVALTAAASPNNPTVYRDEVFAALQAMKPGVLRFMDSGTDWGSSIDNMLQPDFARQRAGYSNHNSEMDDMPLSLHDFLVLCQAIGAEPWYTMPTGMSTQEMSDLMDYLGGSTSTVYGARRAALGQTAPWTTVFPTIHLEFGNEVWNTSNPGASMNDPTSYGKRASVIFGAAKASPSYSAKSFDLIQGGWQAVPYWTQTALNASANYDTVDVAAYIFSNLNDTSSIENIYGPMFAEPEQIVDTPAGLMSQLAVVANSAPKPAKMAVYETNMGTISGTASQDTLNQVVPSVGAGLATAENMLLTMRDLGINDQNLFALPGLTAPFYPSGGSTASLSPIWGVVIDMGGATNLVRPMYLSEELANSAILPTLLSTTQTGANPTWNQPYTTNDNFSLNGAHYLQSFAFTDGNKLNIIVFNLSRTTALPINFAGLNTPLGNATISTLTAPEITATNETQSNVNITSTTQTLTANSTLTLAPFSMTVVSVDAPVVPIAINSITASCANKSLSPNGGTTCSANVVGQGKYDPSITWSVDNGAITSGGVYQAPASVPASGQAVVTVTSVQDSTKSASFTILIANDTITGVTASCPVTSIGQGQITNCKATVSGTGGFSPAFTWSTSGGSISPNGSLTAPATGTSVTVTATSVEDPTKSASVTIPVFPVLIMGNVSGTTTSTTATISWGLNLPAHSGISYGTTQSFGSGTPYNPSTTNSPSITLTGLKPSTTYYMAIYSFVNGQTVSQSYSVTTSSSSSTVTGVTVSCGASSLQTGASTTCSAAVAGTGSFSTSTNWSVSAGTITSGGVLTAPATGTSITVTATSTQDPTKSATALISLTPSQSITGLTVNCSPASISTGASTTCSAQVAGTGSYSSAVTWTASAGSITPAGVLTAPATGSSVTVTATSTQDSTKSASATVSLNPALAISNPVATATSSTATIGWTVSIPAHSGISYGATAALGGSTPYDASSTTTPSYTLTGLQPATTYTLVLYSFVNNQTVSQNFSVTTAAAPTITGVSVNCAGATLVAGNSTSCTAAVTGTGSFDSTVLWSASAGNITSAGVFTAPASGTSATITATSKQDATKSASATIALEPVLALSNASASTTATTATVSWTLNYPAHSAVSYGTSAALGSSTSYDPTVKTNPSYTLTGLQPGTTYTAIVYSFVDGQSVNSSFSFTTAQLPAVTEISVSCQANSLVGGSTTACNAPVQGTGNITTAVVWSASAGTISPAGVLTAPTTPGTVTVKATSVQDATKSALAMITVQAPATITGVSVSCAATTLAAGASTPCTAPVTGTGNFSNAVTWSASSGTVTTAGLFTAPAAGDSVTIKATSTQDPTKYATATIHMISTFAIVNPIISATPTTIVVSWTVTQKAHNGMDYGTSLHYGTTTAYDNNTITNPTYTFTGLTPGTTYYGLLFSFNDNGTVTLPVSVTTPKQ